MLGVAVVLVLAACRPAAPADTPADTAGSGHTAGPVEAKGGEPPPIVDTLQPPGWDPGPPRWRPAGPDERLVWREGDGSDGELGFIEQWCARHGNCGCELAAEHHYFREGDRWKIVIVIPDVVVRTRVVRGTCGTGCGQQAPPEPRSVRSLGAARPEDVEIVVEHPRRVVTVTTCTDPMPMP